MEWRQTDFTLFYQRPECTYIIVGRWFATVQGNLVKHRFQCQESQAPIQSRFMSPYAVSRISKLQLVARMSTTLTVLLHICLVLKYILYRYAIKQPCMLKLIYKQN
jgi:hypothetical protein